jgi:hypothetical protein
LALTRDAVLNLAVGPRQHVLGDVTLDLVNNVDVLEPLEALRDALDVL